MNLEKELIGIQRFNGTEFHIWKWQIRNLMRAKGLLDHIDGHDLYDADDEESSKNWKDKDYVAYTLLTSSIDRPFLTPLLGCITAHQVWSRLLEEHEFKNSDDLHELQRQFFAAKMEPGQSLSNFIARLELLTSELKDLGDNTFSDASMISKLTSNLPEGFDHFLTAWESTAKADQTLPQLKLRLRKEERKILKKIQDETAPVTKAFYANRGRGYPMSNNFRPTSMSGNIQSGRGISPSGQDFGRGSSGFQPHFPFRLPPSGHRNSFPGQVRPPQLSNFGNRQPFFPRPIIPDNRERRQAEIAEIKRRTRCNSCGQLGHWWQECYNFGQDFTGMRPSIQSNQNSNRISQASFAESSDSDPYTSLPDSNHFTSEEYQDQLAYSPSDQLAYSPMHQSFDIANQSVNTLSDQYDSTSYQDDLSFDHEITRAYMATSSSYSSSGWVADTGATEHMTDQFNWFTDYQPLPPDMIWPVEIPASHTCFVKGIGNIQILVQLPDRTEVHMLTKVLYIPGFGRNLFSLTKVAKQKIFTICKDTTCELVQGDQLVMTGRMKYGSYILDFTVLIPPATVSYAATYGNIPTSEETQSIDVWHSRLCHLHHDMIKRMATNGSVTGLRLTSKEPDGLCIGCALGKHHRAPFPKNPIRHRVPEPGMLVHSDLSGRMPVQSHGGSWYYIIFQDDCTRYRFVFCIVEKSEALTCFQRVCKAIYRDTGYRVRGLRTDNGGEYIGKNFQKFMDDEGIKHDLTCSYTPEQNSVAERDNRTIMEAVKSCIHFAQVEDAFWAEAVDTIVYTLNRTCSRLLIHTTPFEAYTGLKPSVAHMRPFGCHVFIHIPKKIRKKLDPTSRAGFFLGYSDATKGYRVWDLEKKQVVISRDLLFDERMLHQQTLSDHIPSTSNSFQLVELTIPSAVPRKSRPHNTHAHDSDSNQTESYHLSPSTAPLLDNTVDPIIGQTISSHDYSSSGSHSQQSSGRNGNSSSGYSDDSSSKKSHDLSSGSKRDSSSSSNGDLSIRSSGSRGDMNSGSTGQSSSGSIQRPNSWNDSQIRSGDCRHAGDDNSIPSPSVSTRILRSQSAGNNTVKTQPIPFERERRITKPPDRFGYEEGDWQYVNTAFMAKTGQNPALPSIPQSHQEALSSPHAENWKSAMESEFNSLVDNNTWELKELPFGRKAIKCKWVYALKLKADGSLDRYKARLVAKGCSQKYGIDFKETYSPTVKYESVRMVLAIAAQEDMVIRQFDIKTAFLHGDLEEEAYMQQVPCFEDLRFPTKVCHLKRALYGLRQASRQWNEKLHAFLTRHQLTPVSADSCVYFSATPPRLIVTIFVDDGLCCCNVDSRISYVLNSMNGIFETKVNAPDLYIGLHIERDRSARLIYIHQRSYLERIIKEYGFEDSSPVSTPADTNSTLRSANLAESEYSENFPFSNAIGSLQFAAICSRPDISYAISSVARFKAKPTTAHVNALKRIFKYLRGTLDFKLAFGGRDARNVLVAYADADYAADLEDRRSRSGFVLFLNGGPITWGSKKQDTLVDSTTYAEYVAQYMATKEIIWCRNLLHGLGCSQVGPTQLLSDSQSAIRLAMNPEFHGRTKHIDIKYHMIRDQVKLHTIKLTYVNTVDNVADIFTKALPVERFKKLRSLITLYAE